MHHCWNNCCESGCICGKCRDISSRFSSHFPTDKIFLIDSELLSPSKKVFTWSANFSLWLFIAKWLFLAYWIFTNAIILITFSRVSILLGWISHNLPATRPDESILIVLSKWQLRSTPLWWNLPPSGITNQILSTTISILLEYLWSVSVFILPHLFY